MIRIFMRRQKSKLQRRASAWQRAVRAMALFSVLLSGLIVPLAIDARQPALAIGLKHNSIVTENTIKLGDIFYDLPRDNDRILGISPQPGQEMVLNANTLLRIAVALGLDWRPAGAGDQITIKREATIIDQKDITQRLKKALSDQGAQGDFEIGFEDSAQDIVLPVSAAPTFEIDDLDYDPTNGWFKASVIAPSSASPIYRGTLSGRLYATSNIPVLKDSIRNGHVITRADLDFITVRSNLLNHDTALSADDLIGMTPRTVIIAGKPVGTNNLTAPQIIDRGQYVTMVFKKGPLQLTAKGKALDSGAKGDMIRVVNIASANTIEATVTDFREVSVQSF